MIGRTLAHFRILDQLGAGATGHVYLAEDIKLGRQVALKVFPPGLAEDDRLKRFQREARVVARLNHPNIVTLFSIEEAGDRRFLCMERVLGETLDHKVPPEGMDLEGFFKIALPIADAVAAAHEAGVIHRDLKPTNIMIGQRVKVLDFGLAKLRDPAALAGQQPLTEEGNVLGTLAYMSPEQLAGQSADARSDIFALGIIYFEMLAGERPFNGPSLPKLIDEIASRPAPLLSSRRGDLPVGLAQIVDRCLEKNPAHRFQTAAELNQALDELADLYLSGSTIIEVPGRPHKPRWWLGLVAGILFVTLATSGLFMHRRDLEADLVNEMAASLPTPVPSRVLVLPFKVRGSDELAYLSHGMVDLLSTKLDGAGRLSSVDPRAVLGLDLEVSASGIRPAQARAAAQSLEAGLFVLGTLLTVGPQVQLTATLYETGVGGIWRLREPLAQASVSGQVDQLFDLIDELTAQLLGSRITGPGGRITRLAAMTTHSLEALKAYVSGETAFRAGHFQEAFNAFQSAVDADSGFALAWYRLSTAAEWLSNDEVSRRGAAEAFAHSQRLSPHDRRLLEGFSASRRGAVQEAGGIYREILATHPDDVETWFQLAEIAFHFSPLDGVPIQEAREPWQKVLRYEPDHVVALLHLARLAAAMGELGKLDELARRFLELSPEGERSLEIRALRAFSRQDAEATEQVTRELAQASDVTLYITAAAIAVYVQDFAGARRLLQMMTGSDRYDEIRRSGHVLTAALDFAAGRLASARAELERAAPSRHADVLVYRSFFDTLPFLEPGRPRLEQARRRLESLDAGSVPDVPQRVAAGVHNGLYRPLKSYLAGLLAVRLGDAEDGLGHAENLEGVDSPELAALLATDLAAGLRAAEAFERGDDAGALGHLEGLRRESWLERQVATSPFFSRARERFLRAAALERIGRDEEALRWYGSFEHQSIHGLVFLAPSHAGRARIYQRQGKSKLAAKHYRAFLELWSNADAELAGELEEARRQLQRLAAAPPSKPPTTGARPTR